LQDAFAKDGKSLPDPDAIEKLICKMAASGVVKKEGTEEVCKLIKEHFPSVRMQPDCETVVSGLWDEIKARCPKGKESEVSMPSPEEIEKLVCEVASSEIIEKKATQEACELIADKYPSVAICEKLLEHLWDEVVARCPKGKESEVSFPSPDEIEKLVCEVASSETIEKEGTEEVCKLIKEYFPSVQMQPDCQTVVRGLWDEIKAMCPKGKKSEVSMPSPDEIEKLVCEVASSEIIEKKATQEACELIKDQFPSVAVCEKILEHLWEDILKKCGRAQTAIVV